MKLFQMSYIQTLRDKVCLDFFFILKKYALFSNENLFGEVQPGDTVLFQENYYERQ